MHDIKLISMKLLAKQNPEITLQEHINDALLIADVLKKSFTNIASLIDENNFRQLLQTKIILHDSGKSHYEFQEILQGKTNDAYHYF